MNIIPTTFNERKVSHTIVGGMQYRGQEQPEDFCVIVLNRGRKYYRPLFFEQLLAEGFQSVISIQPNSDTNDVESLVGKYPQIRFVFPQEQLTVGEMINLGFAETAAPYIMVMWNDTHIPPGSFTERVLEKVKQEHLFCAAPVLANARGEAVPNQIVPSLNGNRFSTEQLPCIKNKTATIYPYDFMGIYSRTKCMRLGGFDYTIENPYWQNLDLGFRAYLWGESIRIFTSFRLHYEGEPTPENISADASYRQFYLKNLAPELIDGEASIPLTLFLAYLRNSGLNPLHAWQHFSQARRWIDLKKNHFKTSARALIEHWEPFI
ncbi:MAG: hypothetical protein ACTTI6_01920 [Treponema sp.]|uniref:hypothetical protein n=1 Tax=Treponema sp. TaxID=166 RepID=UPI003FA24E43